MTYEFDKEECLEALLYLYDFNDGELRKDAKDTLEGIIEEHFELKKEYEKYKKINEFEKECEKFYCKENYFNIIIKALCDCKDKELQDKAIHCLAYLKKQLDNPPLKFEELKHDMWVWDNKTKSYIFILTTYDWVSAKAIYSESVIHNQLKPCFVEFLENRFFRFEVKE